MINYSIIIPHKNIPLLLQRCLDSIPIRDDLEVIVVDDDSDRSLVDFDSFPGKDRKDVEIVLDKMGKGAGASRNIGLSRAKGKWVVFCDADDFFNYCFSDKLDQYKDDDSDVIFFNANSLDTDTYLNANRVGHINQMHNLADADIRKEFNFRYLWGEPWGKFVKRTLIEKFGILCEETVIHNDTQFSYLVGYYASSIRVDPVAIYCLTDRSRSVSKLVDDDRMITRLEVFCKKYAFLKSHGIEAFEKQFIISPFLYFREKNDRAGLDKCFSIANRYGISSDIIENDIKRMDKELKKASLIMKFKAVFHRICD